MRVISLLMRFVRDRPIEKWFAGDGVVEESSAVFLVFLFVLSFCYIINVSKELCEGKERKV